MKIPFNQADLKFDAAVDYFKNSLGVLRVGRGSLQMIENVRAEVYGQSMPINQLANISLVDASLITISPWDKNNVIPIIKAIQASDIGINPNQDGDSIRLPIPPLTEERRLEFIKILHTKTEEAKIAIRQIRKDIIDTIESEKKDAVIGEDEMERLEKELQKKVDDVNHQLSLISQEKEKELMQV
jgi:ribosome recycling factor